MKETSDNTTSVYNSPYRVLIILVLSIFISEAIVMIFLSLLPPFPYWASVLIDSALLIVLLSPMLYFFLFHPLVMHINERKRILEELRKKTEELARRNAELEQFIYIASHYLQEPLRTVSNFSQLLGKRYKGAFDVKADQFLGFIIDGTTRMQKMIDALLTYSRVITRMEPFQLTNFETVFDQALANLKEAVEESNAIVTHSPLPTIMADASQMIQLFQNLLNNAFEFRKEKPHIMVSAVHRENEWLFSVKDNGIGIAWEFKEHIFKMFEREHASDKYPGTGVGLAICRKIVERHGGRIWVESQLGRGSTFNFTIPIRKGKGELI